MWGPTCVRTLGVGVLVIHIITAAPGEGARRGAEMRVRQAALDAASSPLASAPCTGPNPHHPAHSQSWYIGHSTPPCSCVHLHPQHCRAVWGRAVGRQGPVTACPCTCRLPATLLCALSPAHLEIFVRPLAAGAGTLLIPKHQLQVGGFQHVPARQTQCEGVGRPPHACQHAGTRGGTIMQQAGVRQGEGGAYR